jgi:hypothetical protein
MTPTTSRAIAGVTPALAGITHRIAAFVRAGVDGYVLCQASRAPVPQGLHTLVVAQEVE